MEKRIRTTHPSRRARPHLCGERTALHPCQSDTCGQLRSIRRLRKLLLRLAQRKSRTRHHPYPSLNHFITRTNLPKGLAGRDSVQLEMQKCEKVMTENNEAED